MTSDITIGDLKEVKAAKITWKTDVNSFIDTCTIELPRIKYLVTTKTSTEDKNEANERKEYIIKENDKVDVLLGYDGRNTRRFVGYVKRVVQGVPVNVECEGYAYLLYDVIFNKSYASTTAKQIVTDLCAETAIVISNEIPEIPLQNVRFKNATGIQVLEWLKNECKLAVYFNFNELYVGTLFGKVQRTVKLKIGWNTIKDDDFKQREVDKNVKINIREKNVKGEVKRTPSDIKKYSNEKDVKVRAGIPADLLKQIANRLQTTSNYNGYQGDIEIFLEPTFTKGFVASIDGYKFPEKSGNYFVEALKGSFGKSGGRQILTLSFLQQL
ncbi:hypothetical protein [Flavobacterium sp.]